MVYKYLLESSKNLIFYICIDYLIYLFINFNINNNINATIFFKSKLQKDHLNH